jgi:hypothetical protein
VDVGEEDTKEPDAWTVERSLQQFFKEEKRELNCEKCEDGKSATQSMEIISWLVSSVVYIHSDVHFPTLVYPMYS